MAHQNTGPYQHQVDDDVEKRSPSPNSPILRIMSIINLIITTFFCIMCITMSILKAETCNSYSNFVSPLLCCNSLILFLSTLIILIDDWKQNLTKPTKFVMLTLFICWNLCFVIFGSIMLGIPVQCCEWKGHLFIYLVCSMVFAVLSGLKCVIKLRYS